MKSKEWFLMEIKRLQYAYYLAKLHNISTESIEHEYERLRQEYNNQYGV